MKLSQDVEKMTLPGEKAAFRLFGKNGLAILDLLQLPGEPEPIVGQKVALKKSCNGQTEQQLNATIL